MSRGNFARLMYHFVTKTVCYCIYQTECEYSIAVYPEILFLQFINCIIREQYSIIYWNILQSPDKFFYQINSFSAMPAMLWAMSYKPHLIIYLSVR